MPPGSTSVGVNRDSGEGPRLSYAIAALDRSIRRRLTQILEQFDLTVAQYTALSLVKRNRGYSNAQLARRSFVSPQAMHEVLSGLESRALLERPSTDSHRSMRLIFLTPAGSQLLDRCDLAVDAMEDSVRSVMSEDLAAEMVDVIMAAARRLDAEAGRGSRR
jgi:DNA-binding MarR family transcriptional regulator